MTSLMFGADRERRRLGGSTHLVADVAVIFAFAMAPLMLPLERASSAVSLALALAHTAPTVLIARPARRSRDGLATLHAGTEVAVILLCVAALLVPWGRASRLFFGSTGAAILIVWWLTDYRTVAAPAPMAGRE
jgi:hypothetical protein